MFIHSDQLYDNIIDCITYDNVLALANIAQHVDLQYLDESYGNIFLILAINNNAINVINYLLDNHLFDITAKNKDGECPFDYAIRSYNNIIRQLFINHRNETKPIHLQTTASLSKRKRLNSGLIETPTVPENTTKTPKSNNFIERLDELNLPESVSDIVKQKINSITSYNGNTEWLENFFKIPFNKYAKLPVNKIENTIDEIRNYFLHINLMLNKAAYAMDNVKEEIIDIIAQLVSSPQSSIKVIGLCGSPGIGKTHLIKNGLASILNRPFQHLCMGGVSDASYLIGHSHTYTNSKYGTILNCLMNAKVMNPIIFMDEIDKISASDKGMDIQNVLIHLTDPVQNNSFIDKYFQNIEIDLSKVMFIFSFNDEDRIDPILRDRIHIVHVKNPTVDDKINIAKYHLIPTILTNINLPFIDLSEKKIRYIIEQYCKHDIGVRSLKRNIETLLLKINSSIYNPCTKYKSLQHIDMNQVKISINMIEEILIKPELSSDELYGRMYL
jgi:ATP-dependent Lon protease